VLVSIENGSRVLKHYWQDVKKDQNSFALNITADMTPNVYVHVAQLQPHQQRNNDLPIRLYGILPLLVDDPATHLTPAIKAVEKIRPQSTLNVAVSETQGHALTYTLALVDEGLLGITDYSAPDPYKTLYKREALGVLTWDMFDQVVGAYSAELARLLAAFELIYPDSENTLYLPLDLDGKLGHAVFRAVHRDAQAALHWYLDGEYLGQTTLFHEKAIRTTPGEHTLVLVDQNGQRLERKFSVVNPAR